MKIHILGSGAYPLRFQNGRSLSILFPEHAFVVDAGLGLTALPKDYSCETLTIFLTHFHHDHILGLAFLATFLENGQCRRILILGDERIPRLASFFQEPFNPDYTSQQMPIDMRIAGEDFTVGKLRVSRKQVPHSSGYSNLLNITDGEKIACIATDTTADEKNADYFKKADLLLHECNYDNAHAAQAIAEGHSYPDAIVSLAKKAEVRQLQLIHTDPRFPKTAHEISSGFPGALLTKDDQIITI